MKWQSPGVGVMPRQLFDIMKNIYTAYDAVQFEAQNSITISQRNSYSPCVCVWVSVSMSVCQWIVTIIGFWSKPLQPKQIGLKERKKKNPTQSSISGVTAQTFVNKQVRSAEKYIKNFCLFKINVYIKILNSMKKMKSNSKGIQPFAAEQVGRKKKSLWRAGINEVGQKAGSRLMEITSAASKWASSFASVPQIDKQFANVIKRLYTVANVFRAFLFQSGTMWELGVPEKEYVSMWISATSHKLCFHDP